MRSSKNNMSSNMQRSIDRLLKASQIGENNGKKTKIIDENGKIKFNRLVYDHDTYSTILSRIVGFDYSK